MLPPAMILPVFDPGGTDFEVFVGAGVLRGWAFQEVSGSDPASFEIYDGHESAGQLIAPISLLASESTRDYPPGNGIMVRTSLVMSNFLGQINGSLWFTPLTHADDLEWAFGERGPYLARPGA